MQKFVLEKNELAKFASFLMDRAPLAAPVRSGERSFVFQKITDPSEIQLDYLPTTLPPKKYFMPQYELLAEYDTKHGQKMQAVVELEDMILFGVHTCDLAGIQCLNAAFNYRPRDLNYLIRKNHITLIGYECGHYCDEHASCALMGNHLPDGGYDLFMTELDDCFIFDCATQRGITLIRESSFFRECTPKDLKKLNSYRKNKKSVFKPEVDVKLKKIPTLFEKGFEDPMWDELGETCLSCGNCTNVCPTCYCFDVSDVQNLDLQTGKRIRVWDSCQNEPFAKIAGGESFRQERKDRKRHRFNRKFRYPVKKFSRFFCTGCGRCTRTCMAEINLKETIKRLAEEYS